MVDIKDIQGTQVPDYYVSDSNQCPSSALFFDSTSTSAATLLTIRQLPPQPTLPGSKPITTPLTDSFQKSHSELGDGTSANPGYLTTQCIVSGHQSVTVAGQQGVSVTPNGNDTAGSQNTETGCELQFSNPLTWVICPVISLLVQIVDGVDGIITDQLNIKTHVCSDVAPSNCAAFTRPGSRSATWRWA